MKTNPCISCGIHTTWSESYCKPCDPGVNAMFSTSYKDNYARAAMEQKIRRIRKAKADPFDYGVIEDDPYYDIIREQEYYHWKNKEADRYISPKEQERLAAEAEQARLKYEQSIKLQDRVRNAQWKDCAECENFTPHDSSDYLCIKCRDGEAALHPSWARYMPSRPTPEPSEAF